MVMEVVHEDMGDGSMQCTNHPYRNSTPGGICAFCLQEKLGKLVSSSFPVSIFPSSSSSSSRSDGTAASASASASGGAAGSSLQAPYPASSSSGNDCTYNGYYARRARLPFVLTQKKKKKKDNGGIAMGNSSDSSSIVFKRSKSTATPRRGMHFLNENYVDDYSPHRRKFWSLFYLSKNSSSSSLKKGDKTCKDWSFTSSTPRTACNNGGAIRSSSMAENHVSPDEASLDRKVSRSRSVGCGSRSFSGDLFERISTGFGDCTLRRVESQREGGSKPKVQPSLHKNNNVHDLNIEERVRCGGIFRGFTVNSSSGDDGSLNGKTISAHLSHGRSKSWGWAFASPMRAFSKPSSNKRDNNHNNSSSSSSSNKNVTPNLAAIPSLLAVVSG